MKNKAIIIASIFLFLLLNTSSLWKKLPGLWDMGIMTVLVISFIILSIVLLVQIFFAVKVKFKNREKNISTTILALVLLSCVLFPNGIVNSSTFEEPNMMFAQYEGVANCTESLKFKYDKRFTHTSVCFGVDEYKGSYEMVGDTVKLHYKDRSVSHSRYAYGIIELDSISTSGKKGRIMYYRNLNDENPLPMAILLHNQ